MKRQLNLFKEVQKAEDEGKSDVASALKEFLFTLGYQKMADTAYALWEKLDKIDREVKALSQDPYVANELVADTRLTQVFRVIRDELEDI